MVDYANVKFLIYNCWEIDTPYKLAGDLLLDGAYTEEEAKEKIKIYKDRKDKLDATFPRVQNGSRTRFIYIVNKPYWWTKATGSLKC